MVVGKAGAKNAAHLALRIIATSDKGMLEKLKPYRRIMARKVQKKAARADKQQ